MNKGRIEVYSGEDMIGLMELNKGVLKDVLDMLEELREEVKENKKVVSKINEIDMFIYKYLEFYQKDINIEASNAEIENASK